MWHLSMLSGYRDFAFLQPEQLFGRAKHAVILVSEHRDIRLSNVLEVYLKKI